MALIGIVKNKPTRHDWIRDRAIIPFEYWHCLTCGMRVRSVAGSPFRNMVEKQYFSPNGWEDSWEIIKSPGSCLPLGYDDVLD